MLEKVILKNGVTVLIEEMQGIRSVAVGIFVKNGSRNESRSENGISHFIEHMLFKGTSERTAGDIAAEIDMAGGQLNAYTTKEYTCFYTRVLDNSFEAAFDVLSDMYFNSRFSNDEIKKELGVIIEEINMYEDIPEDLVFEQLQMEIWKDNSLGRAILGTKESISKFEHNDFVNYMQNHYRTDNTVISIAGNIKADKAVKIVEKYFLEWKNIQFNDNIITPAYSPCDICRKKDIEQEHICITYEGVSVKDNDKYNMAVLNTLTGGGMSSVIYQKIREEQGLAYTVYSFNSSYTDTGLFTVYMGLNPVNSQKAIDIVRQELKNIKTGDFSDEMIEKSKLQIKNNYLLGLESTSAVMTNMGRSYLMKKNVPTSDEVVGLVDKINKESVKKLAQKILNDNKESISIVTRNNL